MNLTIRTIPKAVNISAGVGWTLMFFTLLIASNVKDDGMLGPIAFGGVACFLAGSIMSLLVLMHRDRGEISLSSLLPGALASVAGLVLTALLMFDVIRLR